MANGEVSDTFLLQVFRKVDADGSGAISSNELQAALSNGTWSPFNPETVRMMIGMFDQDGSSTIDFQEFRALWRYVSEWEKCFRRFDLDGSGSIDKHELKTALTSFGYRLSDRFYDLLIKKFDRTGRGTVAFDDFIQACISIQTLTNAFRQFDHLQTGQITIGYEDFLNLVFSLKISDLRMSQKRKLSESEEKLDSNEDESSVISPKIKKKPTPGVIYLSRIPTKMNVTILRSYFDQYGKTGRIYLQLSKEENKGKRERGPKYTEGWVEFQSKREAKLIAKQLNNQQVGGRRRTPWYEDIWNIKYLSKFRWAHLHERFQYENEVRKKRLRQEVLQAKREATLYIENVEKGKKLRKLEKKMENSSEDLNIREWNYDQQDPDEAAARRKSKKKDKEKIGITDNLLKQIFPS